MIAKTALWSALFFCLVHSRAAGQGVRDTVYLDPSAGTGDGKTALHPARSLPAGYSGNPGVTMLYKRGSVIRGEFPVWSGTAAMPVIVGAYGQGAKPVFMKSIALTAPADWVSEGGNIWRSARNLKATPCANFVYNDGEYCGAMRWSKFGLAKQGDWFMYDTAGGAIKTYDNVYLYSTANPASVYRSLEYVPIGNYHTFDGGQSYIQVQDIHIQNAGTHGFQLHGSQASGPHHIDIRRCDISYIGGAPFTYRIGINGRWVRFGNAVEVWMRGDHLTIEQCRLWENYDASFDVQGSCGPACVDSVVIRHNIMWNAGFDHFDQFWGKGVSRVYFENNTCLNAGGGWPFLTEGRPRLSEFLPDSVGWHVTLDSNGLGVSTLHIRNNIFANAASNRLVKLPTPNQGGWANVEMDHNLYYQANPLDPIAQYGTRLFTGAELSQYRTATGKEAHAVIGDPLFVAPEAGDYRLRPGSPAIDAGGPNGGGMDFSDSIAGFRGNAMDIGAWEYPGQAATRIGEGGPGIAGGQGQAIRVRGSGIYFNQPIDPNSIASPTSPLKWARCEIIAADGTRILETSLRKSGDGWILSPIPHAARAGFVLIRIRTDRGEYFRSAQL